MSISPGRAATAQLAAPALGAVVINGSSAFAAPQLFPAYQSHLGSTITRECARTIATALADLYVRSGFIRPEMAVDDSLMASGVLRFDVYEARVTRVVFAGERGSHGESLDRIAARLTSAAPLRSDSVTTALREMRAIPGITVTASTRRDAEMRNAFELVVQTRFSRIDGVVRINNRGTDEVGPGFTLGQVFANGLLGGQERIGVIFAAATDPTEYLGGGLAADAPLGDTGARASVQLFHSRSRPNEEPVNLDDRYRRNRAMLRISHPLMMRSSTSLNFNAGLEADNLRIVRSGSELRDERLRVAEISLRSGLRSSAGMQFSANLLLRKGMDGLGAGLEATDLSVDPRRADFFVTQLQTTTYQRFREHWSVRLDTFAQYTDHVLPDGERFKIGGDRLGRGFEVAEIAGDRGLGAKLELRRDLFDAGAAAGRIASYAFYDIGGAWKQNVAGRETAATSGLGFAMSGASLTGYLEVATPVAGPDIEGQRKASVFAELSWRF